MMEGSNTLPSGSYGIPRQPQSTKAKQQTQFQATLNLQQIVQIQNAKDQAANNHKSSASLYHPKQNPSCKPPISCYDNAGSSASSTPNHAAQQQRAFTQLYQQTAQTPLSTSSNKQYGQSSKHCYSSNTPAVPKQTSKGHHSGASQKKESSTKQVDLRAKFASLLKQSKDIQKQREIQEKLALAQAQFVPNSGKQDKKGEKRDFDKAAAARNQLFGETCPTKNQGSAQKEAMSSAKQGKDAVLRNSQMSPSRVLSNLRQTPVNQQMLIIQNSGASPMGGRQFMNTIDAKTYNSNYHHQSLIQGVAKPGYFPRQASQTIPIQAVENLINQYQGAQRPEAQTREAGGRSSQQYHSTSRAASSSQTRSKKRVRAQNTSTHLRQNLPQNSEVGQPTGGPADHLPQRNPNIQKSQATTSTKSKKKKQQPSQQQTGVDPIEEYLANTSRLIQQTRALNGQPAVADTTPTIMSEGLRPPDETGLSAALSSLHSHSMQALISHNATSNFGMIENQESLILAQFKAKCQQEMQAQTKQAVAKLLYTKREILMELKAVQASFKAQVQAQASLESSRSHHSSQQVKTEPNLTKKEQQAAEMASQLSEHAIKDLIKQHAEMTESTFRADIQENNEQMEERIDDILVQIQGIISGLEDSIYSRFEKVENQLMFVANELDTLKTDQQVQIAHSLAQQSLDSLHEFQSKVKSTFVGKDSFRKQMEEFNAKIDEQIRMPSFKDKNTDSMALNQLQFDQLEAKIQDLQSSIAEESEQLHQHQMKEQEERLALFQEEISQLVANSLQETWQDFEQFSITVKEDVQEFIQKELLAKEQKIDNKMEKTKQQFLKAINGNMRVLDNLISDYTTRTREQIRHQLRTGASSRTKSNQLHRSNQEQDILEELQSLHGSNFSGKSNSKQNYQKQNQFGIDAVTAQSQQLAGSLSSVQDVSESIRPPGDADQSSQLLSTARDRLNQQEGLQNQSNEQRLRGVIRDTTISNEYASRVPSLNMNGMLPRVQQSSSNSERLNMPRASLGTGATDATASRSGNPLFQDAQDYNTPEKTILQTFNSQGHQYESRLERQDLRDGHEHVLTFGNPQLLVVEEQKFTRSQEEESSIQNQVQSGIPSPEPVPQSEGSSALQEQDQSQKGASPQRNLNIQAQQRLGDRAETSEQRRRRENEEKWRREEEYRQLMDGDLEERSMDQIKLQMEHGNVLPMVIRKTASLMPQQPDEKSRLCSEIHSSASVKEEGDASRKKIDEVDDCIDFALSSNSPYIVKSGRGFPASQDSEGLEGGTVYNFEYKSMQTSSRVDQARSLSMKQHRNGDKGAISMRLTNVISPVQIVQTVNQTRQQTGSSSVCKQENTDSEFWNLTVDDESQIDPVLVMRNINYTNLNSGATSVMHIQEANNQTGSKQSFADSCSGGQEAIKVRERAYQYLDIDQWSREQNQPILTEEEPYQVQLINNDGNHVTSDAHIQEFSPVTSTPLDMQRSFTNGDDDNFSGSGRSRSLSQDDMREQLNDNNRSGTRPFEEAKFENNSLSAGDLGTGEDKDLSDSIIKADGMISSLRQTASSTKMQPQFTSQQARRSAMVPMMEERIPAAQSLHEQSQISSKSSKQMQARSGMKIGTELPLSLQRQGNEIIHQILLDEVFAALDEVLGLDRDRNN